MVEELRIGNLIYIDDIIHRVSARMIFEIESGELNYIPIKLTEEWLIKFGFKKEDKLPYPQHSHYYSYWINDYKYSFSYAKFRDDWGFYHSYTDAINEEDNNKFDFISCKIKYVHHIQNLFYSLTMTELKIDKLRDWNLENLFK